MLVAMEPLHSQPNMLDAVRESSVSILVENSPQTNHYLTAIRSNLLRFLRSKALKGGFRFNVGHFARDHSFWDDQVVECTPHSASAASEWIESWPASSHQRTPRGIACANAGPHTLAALVTAFADPMVEAVYIASASSPAGSTNDLLQHLRLSSKNRPLHVIFLTQQQNVDYQAMSLLHILSKETNGTFRIAYFDTFGQISQLLTGEGSRGSSWDFFGHGSGPSPIVTFPQTPQRNERASRDQLVNLYNDYFTKSQRGYSAPGTLQMKSFPPEMPSQLETYYASNVLMTNRNPNSFTMGDSYYNPDLFPPDLASKIDPENTMNEGQMNEIRRMFTKLYVGRRKSVEKEKKKKAYRALKAKVYKFKGPMVEDRKRRSSSSSSSSSSISSSDITMSDIEMEKDLHSKSARRKRHTTGKAAPLSTRRSWSTASLRSLGSHEQSSSHKTMHFGMQPPWKPIGSVETSKLSHGPKTDRTGWMNRWQTERVKKEQQLADAKRTKAVQAGHMSRPQTTENRLQLTSYTQTSHKDEAQVETIRDLVRQNNNLIKALEHKDDSMGYARTAVDRTARNRNTVLSRIDAAQKAEKRDWEQVARTAQAKEDLNRELKGLATRRAPFTIPQQQESVRAKQRTRWEELREDRRRQIMSAQERKEAIKRQQQQANYRVMYERLVDEIDRKERNQGSQMRDVMSQAAK